MGQLTYTKLINSTLDLYFKEEYLEAYNFITDNYIDIKLNEDVKEKVLMKKF